MSEKRTIANKENALNSTGPRTKAGKARSSLNATKHRGYAKFCLEGEDVRRFKMLLLDLLAQYQPVGFEEKLLVQEIAETIWRKNRFKVAEALTLHAYSFEPGPAARKADIGYAMMQDASAYGTVARCLAAEDLLHKRLWALFDRLRKLQKKRGFYPCKALPSAAASQASPNAQPRSPGESPGTTPEHEDPASNVNGESQGDETAPRKGQRLSSASRVFTV